MKTKPSIRRTFLIAVFSLLITSLNFHVNAQSTDTTPVDFKYIGLIDNRPVFQLNILNTDSDEYAIKIYDEDGYIFYYNTIRSKNFNQKFQLEADELPKGLFNVEIKSRKKNIVETYRVMRNTRLVQETSVTKL